MTRRRPPGAPLQGDAAPPVQPWERTTLQLQADRLLDPVLQARAWLARMRGDEVRDAV
jgi:hypothetical protein